MKLQYTVVPVLLMFALMPTLAFAAGLEEGSAGRYQLTVGPGAFGDTVFMIDTATGRTWQLKAVDTPMPNGSPGVVNRWFPIEKDDNPLPTEPIPARK